MKFRLPRRRILRAVIYLFSFALIMVALDLILVEWRRTIHPGYDVTRITSPTLPEGSIDYVAAVEEYFSRGVTPENNAAIPIFQAFGRKALAPTQPEDGITTRMGMPHLEEKGDYFLNYAEYGKDHPGEDNLDVADLNESLVWPVTIKPATAEWVKANDGPLAKFTEAATRSRYFVPFNGGNRPTSLISVLIPHVGRFKDVPRALLTRAVIRLDSGDVAGFRSDIHVSHRLARLLGEDSTIIGRLVGVAMERSTCRIERLGLSSGKLSPQDAREMLTELTSMGEQPLMTDCVDFGERFMGLDAMETLSRSDSRGRAEMLRGVLGGTAPDWVFRFWPISYDDCMRGLNSFYDGAIVAARQPTQARRVEAFKEFDDVLQKMAAQNYLHRILSADWPPLLLIPALLRCTERVELARLDGKLTEVTLALALFKSDHGAYPAALSELAPGYLSRIPEDFFSEKSPIYSRTDKGYTLYSVGPNMKDDKGKQDDLVADLP